MKTFLRRSRKGGGVGPLAEEASPRRTASVNCIPVSTMDTSTAISGTESVADRGEGEALDREVAEREAQHMAERQGVPSLREHLDGSKIAPMRRRSKSLSDVKDILKRDATTEGATFPGVRLHVVEKERTPREGSESSLLTVQAQAESAARALSHAEERLKTIRAQLRELQESCENLEALSLSGASREEGGGARKRKTVEPHSLSLVVDSKDIVVGELVRTSPHGDTHVCVVKGWTVAAKRLNQASLADTGFFDGFLDGHMKRIYALPRCDSVARYFFHRMIKGHMYLFFQSESTSLRSILRARSEKGEPSFPAKVLCRVATQMASGLQHLHSNGIFHYNLVCSSIFVERSEFNDFFRVFISHLDIGLYQRQLLANMNFSTIPGLMFAMELPAPELLKNTAQKVSPAVDVYAFGMCLYEMLVQEKPFAHPRESRSPRALSSAIMGGEAPFIPAWLAQDPSYGKLLAIHRKCIALEPDERPSVKELVEGLNAILWSGVPPERRPVSEPVTPEDSLELVSDSGDLESTSREESSPANKKPTDEEAEESDA